MTRADSYETYHFRFELEGIVLAGFEICTGLDSAIEVIVQRDDGHSLPIRKLPGKASYHNIVLTQGVADSRGLDDWHALLAAGQIQRKNGSIILLDDAGAEQSRWNFFNAWPSKYDRAAPNTIGSEVAIHTLELACERLEHAG